MNNSQDRLKQKKGLRPSPLLGACAAAIVLALLLVIYMVTKPVAMAGSKDIAIEVVGMDGTSEMYAIITEAKYLIEAIDAIPDLTVAGTTTEEFGLMVITINGVRADYQKDAAYWALLCDGQPCNYGVTNQPIKDGEHYSFVYTPAGP